MSITADPYELTESKQTPEETALGVTRDALAVEESSG